MFVYAITKLYTCLVFRTNTKSKFIMFIVTLVSRTTQILNYITGFLGSWYYILYYVFFVPRNSINIVIPNRGVQCLQPQQKWNLRAPWVIILYWIWNRNSAWLSCSRHDRSKLSYIIVFGKRLFKLISTCKTNRSKQLLE